MNVIDIVDPGWGWQVFVWCMVPGAAILVVALAVQLLSFLRVNRDDIRSTRYYAGILGIVGGIALGVGAAAGGIAGTVAHYGEWQSRAVSALQDAGYQTDSLGDLDDGDGYYFVGVSDNGVPMSGLLFQVEGNKWQVISGGPQ